MSLAKLEAGEDRVTHLLLRDAPAERHPLQTLFIWQLMERCISMSLRRFPA